MPHATRDNEDNEVQQPARVVNSTPSSYYIMSFNGPIIEPYPSPSDLSASTVSHTQNGFKISARKLPISKSGPIDDMEKSLTIRVPEMIFGDNIVAIEHLASGWNVEFNSYDALDRVDKTDKTMLQVAYAREWTSSRENTHEGIKDVVKPFDWSYTTDYKGTVKGTAFAPTTEQIPIELLKRRDPILFTDEVVLYESEMDDNGISLYSCKFRVMPERMLLLCRNFMRLDNVLFRIRDTRIYVDFATRKVIREYTATEEKFDVVKQKLLRSGYLPDAMTVAMRDANQIASFLPKVDYSLESVSLD